MHLRNMLKGQEEAVVVHAFLRFDENHSTRGILAGLVGQLLQHRGSNSPTRSSRLRIVLAYHATEDALEEKELAEVFASLIDTFERVFVVIDGLDEVPENVRESLLATLIPCSQIGLLMTSRPLSHVIAHYAPHAECVTIQAHAEDLSVYVSERAKQSAKLQAILRISGQGDRLVKELSERIQEVSRGMYAVSFSCFCCNHDHSPHAGFSSRICKWRLSFIMLTTSPLSSIPWRPYRLVYATHIATRFRGLMPSRRATLPSRNGSLFGYFTRAPKSQHSSCSAPWRCRMINCPITEGTWFPFRSCYPHVEGLSRSAKIATSGTIR